jgi:predicted NAD/FAD-binding protein
MIEMLINKKVGYTNVVGILAEIMEQTRKSTIKLITSLDTEKLDYMDETFVNSLAKLTMHICAVE